MKRVARQGVIKLKQNFRGGMSVNKCTIKVIRDK